MFDSNKDRFSLIVVLALMNVELAKVLILTFSATGAPVLL